MIITYNSKQFIVPIINNCGKIQKNIEWQFMNHFHNTPKIEHILMELSSYEYSNHLGKYCKIGCLYQLNLYSISPIEIVHFCLFLEPDHFFKKHFLWEIYVKSLLLNPATYEIVTVTYNLINEFIEFFSHDMLLLLLDNNKKFAIIWKDNDHLQQKWLSHNVDPTTYRFCTSDVLDHLILKCEKLKIESK